MITCPHCNDEMRDIHEYISQDDITFIVWHCCRCDFTLVLKKEINSVIWEKGQL